MIPFDDMQVTTLTFHKFSGFRNKVQAFRMMGLGHRYLKDIPGMSFYRLLGSGRGLGFNPWPDWSTYAILQVWDSRESAEQFFTDSELMTLYRESTEERVTLYMHFISGHGTWAGQMPFQEKEEEIDGSSPIAVITRAMIRTRHLIKFWRYVPTAQKPVKGAPGLIYTKGIGEIPILNMATFSMWDSLEHLKEFAYNTPEHSKAVRMTRELDWYSEELFARFQVVGMTGKWSDLKTE